MKLPIVQHQTQADIDATVRAVHRARLLLAQTSAQVYEVQGEQVSIRADRPGVRSLNFAADLELPRTVASGLEATAWLESIGSEFTRQQTLCHQLFPRQAEWPDVAHQAATALGYQPKTRLIFQLRNYKPPTALNQQIQVVQARTLYLRLPTFFAHQATLEHQADTKLAADWAATQIDFLDEPRLELLIARLGDREVASAGVLSLGQVGVIIPAWADPVCRGQRVAATLMSHLMDVCARSTFEQVILERSDGCWSIGFYEALGFTRLCSYTKYRLVQS